MPTSLNFLVSSGEVTTFCICEMEEWHYLICKELCHVLMSRIQKDYTLIRYLWSFHCSHSSEELYHVLPYLIKKIFCLQPTFKGRLASTHTATINIILLSIHNIFLYAHLHPLSSISILLLIFSENIIFKVWGKQYSHDRSSFIATKQEPVKTVWKNLPNFKRGFFIITYAGPLSEWKRIFRLDVCISLYLSSLFLMWWLYESAVSKRSCMVLVLKHENQLKTCLIQFLLPVNSYS